MKYFLLLIFCNVAFGMSLSREQHVEKKVLDILHDGNSFCLQESDFTRSEKLIALKLLANKRSSAQLDTRWRLCQLCSGLTLCATPSVYIHFLCLRLVLHC
jgi:hypothetical protein